MLVGGGGDDLVNGGGGVAEGGAGVGVHWTRAPAAMAATSVPNRLDAPLGAEYLLRDFIRETGAAYGTH